ncbi:hypothetical protein HY837_03735 [archaeon]|nr:hypothetical protein [archaeon]
MSNSRELNAYFSTKDTLISIVKASLDKTPKYEGKSGLLKASNFLDQAPEGKLFEKVLGDFETAVNEYYSFLLSYTRSQNPAVVRDINACSKAEQRYASWKGKVISSYKTKLVVPTRTSKDLTNPGVEETVEFDFNERIIPGFIENLVVKEILRMREEHREKSDSKPLSIHETEFPQVLLSCLVLSSLDYDKLRTSYAKGIDCESLKDLWLGTYQPIFNEELAKLSMFELIGASLGKTNTPDYSRGINSVIDKAHLTAKKAADTKVQKTIDILEKNADRVKGEIVEVLTDKKKGIMNYFRPGDFHDILISDDSLVWG